MNKKILLIFFFAFAIRLIALNQSLWLDEAVTANVVKNFDLTQIISKFSPTDFHPPLYYLFMKLWTNLFGYSEIALRMPSILFSLMTGYVVYLIGGVWAMAFFLFNPLIVYYSQEARMYMMATFFLTEALYFLISNIKDQRSKRQIKNQILFGLFLSLAFFTFYGSIFLIASMLLYLLFKKQYKIFILNTLYFILVVLVISPLLYHQFLNSKIALENVANWSATLGKANIKNLLLIPIKFSIGRISFYPKLVYWIISGIWTGFILFTIKTVFQKTVFIKTVFYLLIFPLILGFLVSFFTPMLQHFRFIYLIPILAIILASGKKTSMYRYIEVTGFVIFSLVYLLSSQFHREDWKSLVKSLPKNVPVYMIMSSSDPVKYYSRNLTINNLASLQVSEFEKEITVIPFSFGVHGLDYKSLLSNKGYQLKKEISFREVTYERWVR